MTSKKEKEKDKEKERKKLPIKIMLRHLPRAMTWEELEEAINPVPPNVYSEFHPAHAELLPHSFATLYIAFEEQKDVLEFQEKWDGYLFVDSQGNEARGIVEFAPYNKVPKVMVDEVGNDKKIGTIEGEADYKQFLADLEKKDEIVSLETQIKEIETKENTGAAPVDTPLIRFFLSDRKKAERLVVNRMTRGEKRSYLARREREKEDKVKKPSSSTSSAGSLSYSANTTTFTNSKYAKEKKKEKIERDRAEREEELEENDRKDRKAAAPSQETIPCDEVRELLRRAGATNNRTTERGDKEKERDKERKERPKKNKERPERAIYRPGQKKKEGAN